MRLRFNLYACNAADQYTDGSEIFEDGAGRFAAYVPAYASQLTYWVTGNTGGQIGMGWPDELAREPLCARLEGGVPYESVITSTPIQLERSVNRMIDFSR